jgi:Zn-dependent protease with chaperone function
VVEFQALYYDGRSSASRPVRVRGWTGELEILGAGFERRLRLADVKLETAIGDTPRILQLPDGAQLRSADHAAVSAVFAERAPLEARVHALESRWTYALGAVLVVIAAAWWCVVYGVPLAAREIAETVPPRLQAALGERVLGTLGSSGCAPSALGAAREAELREQFAALTRGLDDGYAYRLELRDCPRIGANAFALPGGTIVVTDGLVKLAQNDEQLVAVLAHEVGHVRHRHGLRLALQSLGVGALVAALAGDAATITGLAVAVPTALLQSGYSRAFEEEADSYAFERLKAIGVSPRYFADILRRLEARRGSGGSFDYLASHPASAERIQRALAAQ